MSLVLRKEEKTLDVETMRRMLAYRSVRVKVTGVAVHRKADKAFLALTVQVDGLKRIRFDLNLPEEKEEQQTHITIGEM